VTAGIKKDDTDLLAMAPALGLMRAADQALRFDLVVIQQLRSSFSGPSGGGDSHCASQLFYISIP